MKLKLIEKKRNVKTRWKVNDLSFIDAMRLAEKRKSVVFLEQLHSMAVERQMQILLKEKYSRMYCYRMHYFRIFLLAIYTLCIICVITNEKRIFVNVSMFFRWTKTGHSLVKKAVKAHKKDERVHLKVQCKVVCSK